VKNVSWLMRKLHKKEWGRKKKGGGGPNRLGRLIRIGTLSLSGGILFFEVRVAGSQKKDRIGQF